MREREAVLVTLLDLADPYFYNRFCTFPFILKKRVDYRSDRPTGLAMRLLVSRAAVHTALSAKIR